MKRSKVEKLASSLGAELSKPYSWGRTHKEVECVAPDGYKFTEGYVTTLVAVYYPEFGESVSDAYKDIYNRLQYGIEPVED